MVTAPRLQSRAWLASTIRTAFPGRLRSGGVDRLGLLDYQPGEHLFQLKFHLGEADAGRGSSCRVAAAVMDVVELDLRHCISVRGQPGEAPHDSISTAENLPLAELVLFKLGEFPLKQFPLATSKRIGVDGFVDRLARHDDVRLAIRRQ